MMKLDDQYLRDIRAVVWFARFFSPRTICAMIDDLDYSYKSESLHGDQRKLKLFRDLAASLRAYMTRAWPTYRQTQLPADPYFTVAGRNGDYTAEDYAAEYLASVQQLSSE